MLGKPKHVENISNDLEVEELANFAVTEHNSQTVSLYVLGRIELSECVAVPQFFPCFCQSCGFVSGEQV
jgi:hypothetical protein